jgi:hypothetical protein
MNLPIKLVWRTRRVSLRLCYPCLYFDSCIFGHNWSGWYELMTRESTDRRHRQCKRCFKVETGE